METGGREGTVGEETGGDAMREKKLAEERGEEGTEGLERSRGDGRNEPTENREGEGVEGRRRGGKMGREEGMESRREVKARGSFG